MFVMSINHPRAIQCLLFYATLPAFSFPSPTFDQPPHPYSYHDLPSPSCVSSPHYLPLIPDADPDADPDPDPDADLDLGPGLDLGPDPHPSPAKRNNDQ